MSELIDDYVHLLVTRHQAGQWAQSFVRIVFLLLRLKYNKCTIPPFISWHCHPYIFSDLLHPHCTDRKAPKHSQNKVRPGDFDGPRLRGVADHHFAFWSTLHHPNVVRTCFIDFHDHVCGTAPMSYCATNYNVPKKPFPAQTGRPSTGRLVLCTH